MAVIGPLGGVAFVKVNGQQYQLRGSLTVQAANLEASGVAGQDGVHGYLEKPTVPYIEGDFSDSGGLSIVAIQAMRGVSVTAQLKNGKTYVLASAWTQAAIQLDTAEAKMKVKWEGYSCLELGVSS